MKKIEKQLQNLANIENILSKIETIEVQDRIAPNADGTINNIRIYWFKYNKEVFQLQVLDLPSIITEEEGKILEDNVRRNLLLPSIKEEFLRRERIKWADEFIEAMEEQRKARKKTINKKSLIESLKK